MPRLSHLIHPIILTGCLIISSSLARAADPVAAVSQLGDDPNSLYLIAGTIDLTNTPSLLDDPDIEFQANAAYVLHFDGPITPERRNDLVAAGVEFGDYLPMYSYIVTLGDVNPADLRALGYVSWLGEFKTEWKTSPNIVGAKPFETEERIALQNAGGKRLNVSLFSGADIADALRVMDGMDAIVHDVQIHNADCTIEVDLDESKIAALAQVSSIRFIAEAPEGVPRNASTSWIAQSNIPDFKPFYAAGVHGENEIVGLIDWDLDENHCSYVDGIPPGPAHRKIVEYFGNNAVPGAFGYHGTHVGCILAGNEIAGTNPDFKGMAYAAKMVMQHYTTAITTTNLLSRLQYAHGFGARLHSNSWGSSSDNSYNAWARDIDQFTRENEEDFVVVAILNGSALSQPGSILSPENAKNCLASAATQDTPNQEMHGSGARGPTTDNRQKPELWFPGCPNSANVNTACGVVNRGCATSWSAPAATGLATLVRQYFAEGRYPTGAPVPANAFTPSGALLKAVLINSAVDMSGFTGYYGTHEGYGRVLLDQAVYFTGDTRRTIVRDVRNADGLSTEQLDSVSFEVLSSAEKLKIALVWTDVQATVGTSFAPVNNLNLIVRDPSNNTLRGNVFSGAESISGGSSDPRNNTEVVLKSNPAVGSWTVEIEGSAVSVGTQGYALVISGDVSETITCLKGDMNDDGILDANDIPGFVNLLLNGGTPRENCAADVNESDGAGFDDVGPFAALLVGVAYCPRIRGDLNGDALVNGADIQGLTDVLLFGGTGDELCAADFDQSGEANVNDAAPFANYLIQSF